LLEDLHSLRQENFSSAYKITEFKFKAKLLEGLLREAEETISHQTEKIEAQY